MKRGHQKFLLTLHVTASVGFVGAIAAFLALALAGAYDANQDIVRSAYVAMRFITNAVIVPLCFAALVTGIVQSLATPWGLVRHYWIVVKLILTILSATVLLLHTQQIAIMAKAAQAGPLAQGDFYGQRLQLIIASSGALVIGLSAIFLSIYKPSGLTRYGWKAYQAQSALKKALRPIGE